jgi:hypothetical protein
MRIATIKKVWDGREFKLSFRRNFIPTLMEKWFEFGKIASTM